MSSSRRRAVLTYLTELLPHALLHGLQALVCRHGSTCRAPRYERAAGEARRAQWRRQGERRQVRGAAWLDGVSDAQEVGPEARLDARLKHRLGAEAAAVL